MTIFHILYHTPHLPGSKQKNNLPLHEDIYSRPFFSADHEYCLRFCGRSIFLHDFHPKRQWSSHTFYKIFKNQNPIEVIEFEKLPKYKIENSGTTQFTYRSDTTVSEFCVRVTNSEKLTHPTQLGTCDVWSSMSIKLCLMF